MLEYFIPSTEPLCLKNTLLVRGPLGKENGELEGKDEVIGINEVNVSLMEET